MKKVTSIYVSVLEGNTPDETRPILMTCDPVILSALADAVSRRLGFATPLCLVRDAAVEDLEGE